MKTSILIIILVGIPAIVACLYLGSFGGKLSETIVVRIPEVASEYVEYEDPQAGGNVQADVSDGAFSAPLSDIIATIPPDTKPRANASVRVKIGAEPNTPILIK